MASGSTAMWEGCTNHALLRLHVRPARSIFSDALNFCRTFSAMRAQAGLFTLGQPIDTGPPAPARRLCRDPLRLAESATFVSVLDCEVDIHHCVYCVVLRHRNAVSSQGVMGPHLGFVLSAPKRLPVVVSQGYVPAFMGDSVKLPVGVACRGVDDPALRERPAVPEMTVAAFWLDQDVVPGHTRLRLDGLGDRKEALLLHGGSGQTAEHFEQRAELLPLRNRGLGALAVSVLAVALARRAAATACAAVQSTASLFRRWRAARFPAPGPRSALTGCLKLQGLLVFLLRVHSLAVHFFGTPLSPR